MKNSLILLIFLVPFLGCQDVVEVDLPEANPRLVIDAIMRVDTNQTFVPVEIKVTEASGFFQENPVTGLESARITYGKPVEGAPELLEEEFFSNLWEADPGSGIYVPDPSFSWDQRIRTRNIEPGFEFRLLIKHKNRKYLAFTTYSPSVQIDNLEQSEDASIDGNTTELKVTFSDIPNEKNYYVFDFDFGEFQTLDDQLLTDQQVEFSYLYQKDLEAGMQVDVSILGADQQFHNYMALLVEQTSNTGGVFETPAATPRGNIFDITDLDNITVFDNVEQPEIYPLGYFGVVQEFKKTIMIE